MAEWYFAGETEVLGENLPSATLSTTNPTWIDPAANPGLRGERPATNRLSHGTALILILSSIMYKANMWWNMIAAASCIAMNKSI
jgi:hypothetical protein